MIKTVKKLIAFILVATIAISSFNGMIVKAEETEYQWSFMETQSGDYLYKKDEGKKVASIEKYNGKEKNVVIPKEIDGYTVVRVRGFVSNPYIKSVTLPSTVKVIGCSAFQNCKNLSSVKLNNGLEKIEESAFFLCPKLRTLTIPKSVKEIERWAIGFYQEPYDKEFICYKDFILKCYKGSAAEKYAHSSFNYSHVLCKLIGYKNTPAKVTLNSVKKDKKTDLTVVSWKKTKNASGYTILYSNSKDFSNDTSSFDVRGKNVTSKKIWFASKKTYYVKVAAFRKIGSKKYYGDFSSVKKIKTK